MTETGQFTHGADDLDDVEGHGLREVALCLGAAAVVAGGAGPAAAAAGLLGPTGGAQSTAAGVSVGSPEVLPDSGRGVTRAAVTGLAGRVASEPVATTDRLADHAVRTARTTRDAALDRAGRAASTAQRTAPDGLDPHVRVDEDDDGSTTVEAGAAGTTVTFRAG